jgi:hypothetical protein
VWDASVRDDVFVGVPALHLSHCLDLLAVLLRFIVLLAVLMQAMSPFDVGLFGARLADIATLGGDITGPTLVQLLDEAAVRLLPVLALGVSLRSSVVPFPVSHRRVPQVIVLTGRGQAWGQRLPPAAEAP